MAFFIPPLGLCLGDMIMVFVCLAHLQKAVISHVRHKYLLYVYTYSYVGILFSGFLVVEL